MAGRLSGVDAISPALERTKRQLFMPFRFKHWLRLAVVCVLTGEITGGGGGGGFQGLNGINIPPPHTGRRDLILSALPGELSNVPLELIAWIALGAVALVLFLLLLFYISSVYRFILFDAVVSNRCELAEGWRRWQRQGSSYFLWQIGFGFVSLAVLGAVIGVPVFMAWRAGMFRNPDEHLAALILGGLTVFFMFMLLMVVIAVISLFAKDFVVPVMALEGRGALDGWRRFLPMLGQEKGSYAFYVVMKIVLAIGCALLFGILDFLIIFLLLIPTGLAGIAIFLIARGAGLTWNPLTIGAAIAAGCAILLLLVAVIALVSTPAMVFFQAYTIHFFGSRYPALGSLMSLPEPSPPPLPSAAAPIPIT